MERKKTPAQRSGNSTERAALMHAIERNFESSVRVIRVRYPDDCPGSYSDGEAAFLPSSPADCHGA